MHADVPNQSFQTRSSSERSRGRGWAWLGLIALFLEAQGIEWPQFRGPNGDGTTAERIQTDWPAAGPRLLWRVAVTNGFSSLAVSQGKVVTQVTHTLSQGIQEMVITLDAADGRILWGTPLPPIRAARVFYDSGGGEGDGPRSTPTIKDQRVYVLNSWLVLACLDLNDGHVIWSKDLSALYGGQPIAWQSAASPVIENDFVIVNCNAPNKTLLALRTSDGSEAWQGTVNARMTHSTPVATTLHGVRQLVFYAQSGLISVNPTNGAVLWRQPTNYNGTSVAASPVIVSNLIYSSAAYRTGAWLTRVTKPGATFTPSQVLTKPDDFENHWVTPIATGGYLYMIEGQYGSANDPLVCVKLDTLETQWAQEGFGHAGGILVRDKLLMLTESGYLVLVQPDPVQYRELERFKAVSGKCWNVPAVSNGRIYVRSVRQVAAFDVAAPPPPALQLQAPSLTADRKVLLRLGNVSGGVVDPARAGQIDVYATADPESPFESWARLAGPPVPEGGLLQIEDPTPQPLRFYRAVERP